MVLILRSVTLILLMLVPAGARAKAPAEPPTELLENLEFFQDLEMLEDSEFSFEKEETPPMIKKSTGTLTPAQEEKQ